MSHSSRFFLVVLIGLVALSWDPPVQGQVPAVVFHVIGDIDGPDADGALTIVRDATKANGVIYAVGGAVSRCPQSGCLPPNTLPQNTDTPFLWQFDGTNETMQALPDIDTGRGAFSQIGASDITPDGRYIASQARMLDPRGDPPTFPLLQRAVRVDATALPLESANLDLNTTFPPISNINASAQAISDDGAILYGNYGNIRGVRFDTVGLTSTSIPFLVRGGVTDVRNFVARRGVSADGDVAVGVSMDAAGNFWAYRYSYSEGPAGEGVSSAIPRLPGGSFNNAAAVSQDGDLVLVTGHNPAHATVEVYLYRASTEEIQELGSPNSNPQWGPGGRICANGLCTGQLGGAGMTADGSVVAINFGGSDGQYAYFHNQHGWFHLASVLGANGIDLAADGWDPLNLVITGMSSADDGSTLVFGAGIQNDVAKGFVAEFADGVLAGFNPQPAAPVQRIVGVWTSDDPGDPGHVIVFTPQGVYYHIEGEPDDPLAGFEWGYYYTPEDHTIAITTLFDSNGTTGLSDTNGSPIGPVFLDGDSLLIGGQVVSRRIAADSPGSIVGGWVGGEPTESHNSFVLAFAATKYFLVYDFADGHQSEVGTYEWNLETDELVVMVGGEVNAGNFVTPSPDERTLHVVDDGGEIFDLRRVISRQTPRITSALSAVATVGLPFAYQITATNSPETFGASGHPVGLSIDTATGLLSGIPATQVGSPFDVLLEATNTVSTVTGRNHLSLVVVEPAEVPLGPAVVTPVEAAPGEAPPVTLEFTNVTSGGTISVATIDPETVLSTPDPPAGFSLGDDPVYYEITPSEGLTFDGPVTVCFSYAGIAFAGYPRLLHYDVLLEDWVDITASVDTVAEIICGLTSSFSPFAIAASALGAVGFHQPIEPVAGAMNTVKGGSTVGLKFDVFGEGGAEVTSTAGITFSVSRIACDTGAHEDDVEAQSTGGTSLRYDATAGQFIQNWKTPSNTPGACYLAKATGNGLLLNARFKMK